LSSKLREKGRKKKKIRRRFATLKGNLYFLKTSTKESGLPLKKWKTGTFLFGIFGPLLENIGPHRILSCQFKINMDPSLYKKKGSLPQKKGLKKGPSQIQ